jgi:hypothetical protein
MLTEPVSRVSSVTIAGTSTRVEFLPYWNHPR